MLKRLLFPVLATCICAAAAWAGPVEKLSGKIISCPPPADPFANWEISLESGALWSVGHNASPLDYVILPQMITFKSPAAFRFGELLGGDLVFRHRLSLLLEPIVEGPEDYYLGFSGSGLIEWWNRTRTFSAFFAAGGGLGWMDSQGYEIEGAQGQDLNFNWFLYAGGRYMLRERLSVSLGLYYQHVSNLGLDDVNPGIDALGPMLGVTWHF
jgi:lipid A 3-O-deacylase